MSLQRLMPWLVVALAVSVAVMWRAAAGELRTLSLGAALGFVALAVVVALAANRAALRDPAREARAQYHMLRRNTRLVALVYAWGAAALFAVYVVGDLKWRHGWQYGAAMALVAALLLWYVHALGSPGSRLATASHMRWAGLLARLHGLAAAAGLAFLIGAGKLATLKGDWAANHVFLAGGIGVVLLTVVAAHTHRSLAGRATDAG